MAIGAAHALIDLVLERQVEIVDPAAVVTLADGSAVRRVGQGPMAIYAIEDCTWDCDRCTVYARKRGTMWRFAGFHLRWA